MEPNKYEGLVNFMGQGIIKATEDARGFDSGLVL